MIAGGYEAPLILHGLCRERGNYMELALAYITIVFFISLVIIKA